MKLLLDTHVLLRATGKPERLSEDVRTLLEDRATEPVFSAASLWEVAIKNGLGRPDFRVDPRLLRRDLLEHGYTARGKIPAAFDRRCIPAELRCSSVEYGQYAPSSRLVSRAPRPSRCDAGFHHGLYTELAIT